MWTWIWKPYWCHEGSSWKAALCAMCLHWNRGKKARLLGYCWLWSNIWALWKGICAQISYDVYKYWIQLNFPTILCFRLYIDFLCHMLVMSCITLAGMPAAGNTLTICVFFVCLFLYRGLLVHACLNTKQFHFSCHGDCSKKRNRLILPALVSSRVYVIDTGSNPKAPSIFKVHLCLCIWL